MAHKKDYISGGLSVWPLGPSREVLLAMVQRPAATLGPTLIWCGHCGLAKAPIAMVWPLRPRCNIIIVDMATVASEQPLWLRCCFRGHCSTTMAMGVVTMAIMAIVWPLWPWCGHYGRGMSTMTVAWPLWLLHGPYGHGTAHIAVVRPLWLWYGHYGCGAAVMAVVSLLWPSFGPSGPIYDLAMLPAAAALPSFLPPGQSWPPVTDG
jgi:hypothetical protein